ncbi:glycosyltransferase [Patescibacteria group bacterium]|nr:glycosyltransferase [Patescibacteria group bacterium]
MKNQSETSPSPAKADNFFDLVFVSSYPPQGQIHGKGTVGVASYAKNTILSLSKAGPKKPKILVLAEKIPGEKEQYQEGNVTVIRCWQRNSFTALFEIFKIVKPLSAQKIVIEFEMAMLGNPASNIFFPVFLGILKLLGKKTFVVVHQVVLDFSQLSGHMGQSKESLKTKTLSLLAKIFFSLVVGLSDKVVVFEQFLKERLSELASAEKILVIPHGVEAYPITISQDQAREKLKLSKDNFILIIFGFLAWYKGTDWLAKQTADYLARIKDQNLKLIIAGGANPNHKDKPFYQKYINEIESLSKKYPKNIIITGFVDEAEIQSLYQAANIVVLPYRAGMSSSGPLAIAFTNHRPVLVSEPLSELFETKDIKDNLGQLGLHRDQITFSLSGKDFWQKVDGLRKDEKLREKAVLLAKLTVESRSWQKVGQAYYQLLIKE